MLEHFGNNTPIVPAAVASRILWGIMVSSSARISVAKIRFDRTNNQRGYFMSRKEKKLLDEGIDDT
jgi:hypothetical protein